jgi:hypothetical protein
MIVNFTFPEFVIGIGSGEPAGKKRWFLVLKFFAIIANSKSSILVRLSLTTHFVGTGASFGLRLMLV